MMNTGGKVIAAVAVHVNLPLYNTGLTTDSRDEDTILKSTRKKMLYSYDSFKYRLLCKRL